MEPPTEVASDVENYDESAVLFQYGWEDRFTVPFKLASVRKHKIFRFEIMPKALFETVEYQRFSEVAKIDFGWTSWYLSGSLAQKTMDLPPSSVSPKGVRLTSSYSSSLSLSRY